MCNFIIVVFIREISQCIPWDADEFHIIFIFVESREDDCVRPEIIRLEVLFLTPRLRLIHAEYQNGETVEVRIHLFDAEVGTFAVRRFI